MESAGRKLHPLITFLFIFLICTPEINRQFSVIPDIKSTEKRNISSCPTLDFRNFSGFVKMFDLFYNDHFGFRNRLVAAHNALNMKVFGMTGVPYVIKGHHDWFFYDGSKSHGNGIGWYAWQGRAPLSNEILIKIKNNLEAHHIWCRERNITLIVLPCPDKHSIYPEYFPWRFKSIIGPSRLTQITEYLKLHTNISIIDIKGILLQIKKKFNNLNTYYKADSHWNNIGGFFAYNEIAKILLASYPKIQPYRFEQFIVNRSSKGKVDILDMAGLHYPHILDHQLILNTSVNHKIGPKLKKLLVFGDSFFEAIDGYLSLHFDNTRFEHRLGNCYIPLNKDIIEVYQPNVILYESVERFWTNL